MQSVGRRGFGPCWGTSGRYQGWLAWPDASDRFIQEALSAVQRAYPRGAWSSASFRPEHRLAGVRRRHSACPSGPARPLLALGPEGGVEKSLKKKHTRNRINRLQRIAPLQFVELQSREEFEQVIDTVADFCDLRQGAVNASLPFRDDPHKREFWLRLMETPGLAHASVLLLGESVIAAHVGPINRASVALGVIAHSPFVADSSPGKLLVLMLARALGLQGFQDLDLTPEGTYKERIADHADEVHLLAVHFRLPDHLKARAFSGFETAWEAFLARTACRTASPPASAHLSTRAGRRLRTLPEEIFALANRKGPAIGPASIRLNVNNLADLLLYRPAAPSDLSQTAFLSRALERLEAGDRAYTLASDGVLQYCGWMGSAPAHALANLSGGFASAPSPLFLLEGLVMPPRLIATSGRRRLRSVFMKRWSNPPTG